MYFSVPGKTFLLGEYNVLSGGDSLLVATQPQFELHIGSGSGECINIHRKSPAGQLILSHNYLFSSYKVEFIDPYKGIGGMGASGSQYLMSYLAQVALDKGMQELINSKVFLKKCWESFREFHRGQNYLPSGSDLITQFTGGVVSFRQQPWEVTSLDWTLEDLGFFICHTGTKVPTHEHLNQLDLKLDQSSCNQIVAMGRDALINKNSEQFIGAINEYYELMDRSNLVIERTKLIIKELLKIPGVRAIKGCGALGADTILVLFDQSAKPLVRESVCALNILASEKDLSPGLAIHMDPESKKGEELCL